MEHFSLNKLTHALVLVISIVRVVVYWILPFSEQASHARNNRCPLIGERLQHLIALGVQRDEVHLDAELVLKAHHLFAYLMHQLLDSFLLLWNLDHVSKIFHVFHHCVVLVLDVLSW